MLLCLSIGPQSTPALNHMSIFVDTALRYSLESPVNQLAGFSKTSPVSGRAKHN